MKSLKLIPLLSLCMIFILTGCQKQPKASYVADKTSYVAGETMYLTNTSIDADHYLWTLPDGQTLTSTDAQCILSPTMADGTISVELEAFSKNGSKHDIASQTFNVIAAKGNAIFWARAGAGFGTITVTIDGTSDDITGEVASEPACGDAACADFTDLKVGTHNYTATDGTTTWSGTITVTKDGCTAKEIL